MNNNSIVSTINWDLTKRESAKELVERMANRQDIYKEDLINLILAVIDFTKFPHLEFWDSDGSLRKKAQSAVEQLRTQTNGYIAITKEQEESRKRKLEIEKKIAKIKSLEDELAF